MATYPHELAEWVKERAARKPRQDKHMVAFLAVRRDVHEALVAGYAMKTIWEHMRETGRLQYRYETFTQHVKRHIKSVPDAPAPPDVSPGPPTGSTPPPKASRPATRKPLPPQMGGFTFDASPKKEDLL